MDIFTFLIVITFFITAIVFVLALVALVAIVFHQNELAGKAIDGLKEAIRGLIKLSNKFGCISRKAKNAKLETGDERDD